MSAHLLPVENIALTMASAMIARGDEVPPNITTALVLTLQRLTDPETDTPARSPAVTDHLIDLARDLTPEDRYTPDQRTAVLERLSAAVDAEVLTRTTPPAPTGPVHLLVGEVPDNITVRGDRLRGQLLVHVWANGTGEVAWRGTGLSSDRWGIPSTLEPAP